MCPAPRIFRPAERRHTIQYRNPQTEALLACARKETGLAIGEVVRLDAHEYRVLYRWQCGPGAPVVYVHKVSPAVDHPAATA